jgi:hypothetical protein
MLGYGNLTWKDDALYCTGKRKPVGFIEPDTTYPGMWRVRLGDRLSNMANRTWAKDAAMAIALKGLNGGK